MKAGRGDIPSREHEEVYHAALCRQAAALSLTAQRLHGQKQVCSAEGKKTGSFASQENDELGGTWSVSLPGGSKDRRIIAGLGVPHAIQDTHPHIGERTQGHRVTLTLRPLALVRVIGP